MELPEADYYICTGNILPYSEAEGLTDFAKRSFQADYVRSSTNWREFFGTGQAPVILVRGPKDLVDPSPLFEGGKVFVIESSEYTHFVNTAKVGGMRGVIANGIGTHDRLSLFSAKSKVNKLPADLDFLVTHSSARRGLNDQGLPGLSSYVDGNLVMKVGTSTPSYVGKLKAHFHGQNPRGFGSTFLGGTNGVLISNAAGGFINYHRIGNVWHIRLQKSLFPEKVSQNIKVINEEYSSEHGSSYNLFV
jgi:hypothetical protein